MEEEYTITRPVAASRRAAQASERSYSALGALPREDIRAAHAGSLFTASVKTSPR